MGARLRIHPCTWSVSRPIRGPAEVDGFKVGAHCYRTLAGAKRGAVALAEGDLALADRILSAEKDPEAGFENVEHKLAAYGIKVAVASDYMPTPIEPPSRVKCIAYEYDGCELVNTTVHLSTGVNW